MIFFLLRIQIENNKTIFLGDGWGLGEVGASK